MKIAALYKTSGSSQIIEASLASIYDKVSHIVVIHSDVGWDGTKGGDILERMRTWQKANDPAGKMAVLCNDCRSQLEQYDVGARHIRKSGLDYEMVMLVDADEIWFPEDIDRCAQYMDGQPTYHSFTVQMHTYLKDPHFQVEPPWGYPCIFIRQPELALCGARGELAPMKNPIPNAWMHHFTMIVSREEVRQKILRSWAGDDDSGAPPDPDRWLTEVWDRLPEGENLHYFPRHAAKWKRIRVVSDDELPPAARGIKCSQ